ncbi:MAG TPA: response regulator [Methylomirabilota bacterium]|nr:response regulator [Methylomirabilota bacterium]
MAIKTLWTVLAAEDEEVDLFLLKRAFKEADPALRLYSVTDGGEVINYLSGVGVYADRALFPLPEILLLDLKMPRKNGFEILEWIKAHEGFRKLPVVILTSSHLRSDVDRAYAAGACGYFVKATDPRQFEQQIRAIYDYWFAGAERPKATA